MSTDLDTLARLAHAYRVAHPGDTHAPESCPCRDECDYSVHAIAPCCARCGRIGSLGTCYGCNPLLAPWESLTEPQRDVFRAQAAPFVEVLAAVEARERTLLYWLLRAWDSGHREGWEPGPSVDDTMEEIHDLLANMGCDPTEPEGDRLRAEQHTPGIVPDRSALDALLAQARADVARETVDAARGEATVYTVGVLATVEAVADRVAPGWRGKETG